MENTEEKYIMENELFEKAPVHRVYFKFALPVVFSMVISLVYNMADTYFIAKTGNTDLIAGVSLGAPVFTLMIAFGDIFGLGGSSLISRLFGQKKDSDGKRISAFCFYAALLFGVAAAAVMLLLRTPVLTLLGAESDTWKYASEYYIFLALGAPFIIFSLTPSNILRTEGLALESMSGTILGSVVNIILDPLFIFALNMGAAGAAIATVIGNIFTDLFFIFVILKKSRKLSMNPRIVSIKREELLQLLVIGIPASVTNLTQSLGIALTNRCLLAYGTIKIASMGIVMKVNMIAVLVLIGFAFGAQPLIGYNYGAKNYRRLKEILRFAVSFEAGTALLLSALLSAAAPRMLQLFVNDPEMIETGTAMLRLQLAGMIFASIVLVMTSTFQACGKALEAFLLSVSRQGIILAVILAAASSLFGYYGILSAQAVSDLLTALLAVCLFLRSLFREIRQK